MANAKRRVVTHPVRTLTVGELEAAGSGGKRLRRELRRRWDLYCRCKPPGHLELIPRYTPRSIRRETIANATGVRRWRLERRRARALLLGALELRVALLLALPEYRSSLWLYGVP